MSGNKPTRVGDNNPRWGPAADVPDSEPTRVGDNNPGRFEWTSPRWREDPERGQGDVERDRRDHDESAPAKDAQGAINRKGNRDRRGKSRARRPRS